MSAVDLNLLVEAVSPGGASCLTSTTELAPAGGLQASVAPAKFASSDKNNKKGVYAYERRYLDGTIQNAVLIDSKQSQLNRCEQALQQAIVDQHPVLGRLPRIVVSYPLGGVEVEYSDLSLPHRAFDAHIRAGTVDGQPVTKLDMYRAVRNASPANARALLDTSPISLVFGAWDSSRASHQGRWRSALVGEIIGFCEDDRTSLRGGARVDPMGMKIQLDDRALKALADSQRADLSPSTYEKVVNEAKKATANNKVSASTMGLGGIPPTLEALAGVACHRIIRSHVLSFATLRQIRFGAGPDGDVACRALLAALALNAVARSDAELYLRANCDLVQQEGTVKRVEVDRGADRIRLDSLSITAADELLAEALARAERAAGVRWNGVVMRVTGNPDVAAGSVDEEPVQ